MPSPCHNKASSNPTRKRCLLQLSHVRLQVQSVHLQLSLVSSDTAILLAISFCSMHHDMLCNLFCLCICFTNILRRRRTQNTTDTNVLLDAQAAALSVFESLLMNHKRFEAQPHSEHYRYKHFVIGRSRTRVGNTKTFRCIPAHDNLRIHILFHAPAAELTKLPFLIR